MILATTRNKLEPLFLALLRISTGVIMASHGWEKLGNPAAFAENLGNMGLPSPQIMAYLAIAGEFLGGLGLIVGFLTPLAAFGIAATMAVAVFKVHWANGLFAQNNGFEYPLTLLMVSLFFIIRGAGSISLDCALRCRKKDVKVELATED